MAASGIQGADVPSESELSLTIQNTYPQLLKASETRIVHIQPGTRGAQFAACFEVIDLDDQSRTSYDALSYCCGDITSVSEVYLSDIDIHLPIAKNLTEALTIMLKNGTPGPFWIDAISINQTDTKERNQQVRLMTRIFAGAAQVLTWLGSDYDTIQRAIRLLIRWADPCNNVEMSFQALYQGTSNPSEFSVAKYVAQIARETTEEEFLTLNAFFDRPYFKRAWVIQEISVGRELKVLWNNAVHLPFSVIFIGAWWLTQHVRTAMWEGGEVYRLMSSSQSSRLVSIWSMHRQWHNDGGVPASSLHLVYQYESYDARDKFFATHGIYKLPADIKKHFEVDYDRPVWLVYAEAARGMIKVSSLHILTVRNDSATSLDGDFPSWVPRFDGQSGDIGWDSDKDAWTAVGNTNATLPHAAPGTEPRLREINNPRCLSLLGIKHAGSILGVVSLSPASFGLKDESYLVQASEWPTGRFFILILPQVQLWTSNKREIATAYAECTTMGYRCGRQHREFSGDRATIFADFRAYLRSCLDYMQSKPDIPDNLRALEAQARSELDQWDQEETEAAGMLQNDSDLLQSPEGDRRRYYEAMILACSHRSLVITSDRRIGIANDGVKIGDEIAVFHGAAKPFIVRRDGSGTKWHLIGVAWIDGLMHGELMKEGQEGEWFDLI